jgi:hypothetical protein
MSPISSLDVMEKEKISPAFSRIEILDHPAHSLVTIPTTLFGLRRIYKGMK